VQGEGKEGGKKIEVPISVTRNCWKKEGRRQRGTEEPEDLTSPECRDQRETGWKKRMKEASRRKCWGLDIT